MGIKRVDGSASGWRTEGAAAEPPRVVPLGRTIPLAQIRREEAPRPIVGLVEAPPPQFPQPQRPSSPHYGYPVPQQVVPHQSYPLHPKPFIEARRDPRLSVPAPSYYPVVYGDQSLNARYGIPGALSYDDEPARRRGRTGRAISEISPLRLATGLLFFVSSIFLAVTLAILIQRSIDEKVAQPQRAAPQATMAH